MHYSWGKMEFTSRTLYSNNLSQTPFSENKHIQKLKKKNQHRTSFTMQLHIPHINHSCWQTLISTIFSHFPERNKHTHHRTSLLTRFFPHKQKFKPLLNVYTYLESAYSSAAEVRTKGSMQESSIGIAVNIASLHADFWRGSNSPLQSVSGLSTCKLILMSIQLGGQLLMEQN